MKKLFLYIADSTNPYGNLAAEEYLLRTLPPQGVVLYLWQNAHTVVIGKNQNPLAECRCALLKEEGGKLARRLSGGGAVYHDLGNLNFTFLCHEEDYNVDRQLQVVQAACAMAGIQTARSGRNDLLAQGRKFSGNAFYHSKGLAYHHGTLLISADKEKMQRYLTPPAAKLAAKGVSSVRSRVVNLSELAPDLTCATMRDYMLNAFEKVYGGKAERLPSIPPELLVELAEELASESYLYGQTPSYTVSCEERFSWGFLNVLLNVEKGVVQGVSVYTDAMDHTLPQTLQKALIGVLFTPGAIQTALANLPDSGDLLRLFSQIL